MKDIYLEPNIEAFANRLYQLRKEKSKSARDLSLSLGQSHSYINTIENKKSYPTMANFLYICEYLGVTPQEFFDYDNENPHQSNELYSEIKKMSPKAQKNLLEFIKECNASGK